MKSDSNKYENYVNAMKQKSQEWPGKLEKMKSECELKEEEIKALQSNISELHKILRKREFQLSSSNYKTKKEKS